jgi:molybdenum cofactor cytidylyltransferase
MTGLIILAAGESSRLGQPKQNLKFEGKTLLERAVEAGRGSACNKIIVVLGANSSEIVPISGTTTLNNKDYMQGMASSIKTGIREICSDLMIDNVIIMLCDQPFVNSVLLNSLISRHIESGKSIVASAYNGVTGVPALFDRSVFAELLSLQGMEGAKTILKNHAGDVASIMFEKGGIDIDTPEDYERLINLCN